jgi:hypothetical protein
LKKVEGIQWKKLELDPTDTAKKIVDAPKRIFNSFILLLNHT